MPDEIRRVIQERIDRANARERMERWAAHRDILHIRSRRDALREKVERIEMEIDALDEILRERS